MMVETTGTAGPASCTSRRPSTASGPRCRERRKAIAGVVALKWSVIIRGHEEELQRVGRHHEGHGVVVVLGGEKRHR